jgi:hypothetical protein
LTACNAIDRALDHLAARQHPSGEFPLLRWQPRAPETSTLPDTTPFSAAVIARCLAVSDDPRARRIVAGATRFIRQLMEPGGVWRYCPNDGARGRFPADVDTIACCSGVLRGAGIPMPDNRPLLLANRDRRGLFHTWITPRRAPLDPVFWRVAFGYYLRPVQAVRWWRLGEASPSDVDAMVNASVLAYLGHDHATEPVVDWLTEIVRSGAEASDRWYMSPFSFQEMLSRSYRAGVTALRSVRDESIRHLCAAANPDGSIGESSLDTAWAVCALLNWDGGEDVAAAGAAHLRRTQHSDGWWVRSPFFWGGPSREWAWGSDEVTTAYCVEALLRAPAA